MISACFLVFFCLACNTVPVNGHICACKCLIYLLYFKKTTYCESLMSILMQAPIFSLLREVNAIDLKSQDIRHVSSWIKLTRFAVSRLQSGLCSKPLEIFHSNCNNRVSHIMSRDRTIIVELHHGFRVTVLMERSSEKILHGCVFSLDKR